MLEFISLYMRIRHALFITQLQFGIFLILRYKFLGGFEIPKCLDFMASTRPGHM